MRLWFLFFGFPLVLLAVAAEAPAAPQAKNGGILLANISINDPSEPVHLWLTPPSLHGRPRDLGEVAPNQSAFVGATFSADGSKAIFTRQGGSPGDDAIVSIDLRTGARTPLLHGEYIRAATPAPNGRLLAYVARPTPQSPDRIYVRDLTAQSVRTFPLKQGTAPNAFSWSPDSKTLYSAANVCPSSFARGLCVLTPATGRESILRLPFQDIQGSAVVSPDGRRVAWWDLKGPAGERIASARTGKVVRNIVGEGFDPPIWSPDGNKLIVAGGYEVGGQDGLDIFDLATHTLTTIPYTTANARMPLAWQPLGG